MQQRNTRLLILIVVLAVAAIWVDLPDNPGIHIDFAGVRIDRDIKVMEGLDLQGGLQVILQAKETAEAPVNRDTMSAVQGIIENRVNGLGVSEPLIQTQGANRIIVELPGVKDPDQAIATFGRTGLLEFIDAGDTLLPEGTIVRTSLDEPLTQTVIIPTPTAGITSSGSLTGTAGITSTAEATPTVKVYKTILTGRQLSKSSVGFDQQNRPDIQFAFKDDGPSIFADFTTKNVGKYMAIVLDKRVISCPSIKTPITDGSGIIEGSYTLDSAKALVIVLKYGALPVPLEVIENRTVGATLGADSVSKSLQAGAIGLIIVMAFMLIYYRLPGALADVALIIYALISLALFKLIPVTLTLPGMTGFVLSIGMAVDANILIFERMKEELRAGKTLGAAIEAGFARAWTSIRDSNASTLITCAILFWFGMNFGASIIKGFALTLAIGITVSLFTAITVSRTFLRLLVNTEYAKNPWLFGISDTKNDKKGNTGRSDKSDKSDTSQ
jgi:preprotein translocase subunit SecD